MGLGICLQLLYEVGTAGALAIRIPLFSSTWSGILHFGLYIDRLTAVMLTLITGISLLISIFSIRYMQQESGRARFHALLALTSFTLVCMVASANLLMLFIFWQLLSWLLSLLAYNFTHTPTIRGAFKTYTLLRVGDVAFLSGIVLAYHLYGTLDFQQLFSQAAENPVVLSLWHGGIFTINAVTVLTVLIFIDAMRKSAQIPLHLWLPSLGPGVFDFNHPRYSVIRLL